MMNLCSVLMMNGHDGHDDGEDADFHDAGNDNNDHLLFPLLLSPAAALGAHHRGAVHSLMMNGYDEQDDDEDKNDEDEEDDKDEDDEDFAEYDNKDHLLSRSCRDSLFLCLCILFLKAVACLTLSPSGVPLTSSLVLLNFELLHSSSESVLLFIFLPVFCTSFRGGLHHSACANFSQLSRK